MVKSFLPAGLLVLALSAVSYAADADADKIDFMRDIRPLLEANCIMCHGPTKDKGDLRLDTREFAIKGGDEYDTALVPGHPDKSPIYTTTILPLDDDMLMPPIKKEEEGKLPKAQTDLLKKWIEQGAPWPEGVEMKVVKQVPQKIDFVRDVQPVLEIHCVSCHQESKDKGDLRLDTKEMAFKGGENGKVIVPGKPLDSTLYTSTILPPDHDDIMPPKNGPIERRESYILRRWIEDGAEWPDGVTLKVRKANIQSFSPLKLFKTLDFDKATEDSMKAYTESIPGTDISFDMVPIKGGTYMMGSPEGEKGRSEDEGPQRKITIKPFFMGATEVTWDEYALWGEDLYRYLRDQRGEKPTEDDKIADTITRPTPPYRDMTFGMGRKGYPAICMTQLAAKNYCMWISAKTGKFYRLPTEAEWEYACRAGTTTAYSFGDNPAQLGQYAWFGDNSEFQYQPVGRKKPNPWGLFDMHGNVAEWVLDQYLVDGYSRQDTLPVAVPTTLYPRVVRGGDWDAGPEKLRSAARRGSEEWWKKQDPQNPKSVWYHTDALFVGFRVIQPLELPAEEDLGKYWPTEEELKAVPSR
jgi:formylglycine-generating enzyme required for sulfatase activity